MHGRVAHDAIELFCENGLSPLGLCASPITGAKGNREFFLLGGRGASAASREEMNASAVSVRIDALVYSEVDR